MVNNKIKVGMVGISFGMEFIPIYMKHPDVYEWGMMTDHVA